MQDVDYLYALSGKFKFMLTSNICMLFVEPCKMRIIKRFLFYFYLIIFVSISLMNKYISNLILFFKK